MADTIKKLFDTTVSAVDVEQGGEVTLLTTDANTTAVIKNVIIKNGSQILGNAVLTVDGYEIGTVSTDDGSINGTALVPPSSTVKLKLNDASFKAVQEIIYYALNGGDDSSNLDVFSFSSESTTYTDDNYPSLSNLSGISNSNSAFWIYENDYGNRKALCHNTDGNSDTSTARWYDLDNGDSVGTSLGFNSYVGWDYNSGLYAYGSIYNGYGFSRVNMDTGVFESNFTGNITSVYTADASYAKTTVAENADASKRYIVSWAGSSINKLHVYDTTTDTLITPTSGTTLSLSSLSDSNIFLRAYVMADGNILIYKAYQTDTGYNNSNNTQYAFFNVTTGAVTSYGYFQLPSSVSVSGTPNTDIHNGYTIIGNWAWYQDYTNAKTGNLYRAAWDETTKTINFNDSVKYTGLNLDTGYDNYGNARSNINRVIKDFSDESISVAAFGIESV
jgi:hypothetical protein